jgi:predicted nucleic acid-binding protein
LSEFLRRAAAERADRTLASRNSERLADATLVALAEERGLTRIFTLDDDFRVYRLEGRRWFEVVP